MPLDVFHYYDNIVELLPDEEEKIRELFHSLEFKLERNHYHYENIKKKISECHRVESDGFYKEIHTPLYFEMEGFLVSLRSSVDMLLHLINHVHELGIPKGDVSLDAVFHHRLLPKPIKNIFEKYTKTYDNPTWNFIYTSRNEIVHERSIDLVLPIDIDFFGKSPIVLFSLDGVKKEIVSYFSQCLRFLELFSSQMLQTVAISL